MNKKQKQQRIDSKSHKIKEKKNCRERSGEWSGCKRRERKQGATNCIDYPRSDGISSEIGPTRTHIQLYKGSRVFIDLSTLKTTTMVQSVLILIFSRLFLKKSKTRHVECLYIFRWIL